MRKTVEISEFHLALVYKLAKEPLPDHLKGHCKPIPGPAVADSLSRSAQVNSRDAQELARRLGYGTDATVGYQEVPRDWLVSMLARGCSSVGR